MNTRPTSLALCLALLCGLAATGCEDRAARERQERLEAEARQQQELREQQRALLARQLIELQMLQTEHDQAAQAVQARSERIASLRAAHDDRVARHAQLQQAVQAYMGRHRMAVGAIAAGAVGGGLALSDDGEVSQSVRELGALVGLAALAYAAFNLEEVTQVARELSQADEQLQSLAQEQQDLARQLEQEAAALQQAQGRQQEAAQRVLQLRAAIPGS